MPTLMPRAFFSLLAAPLLAASLAGAQGFTTGPCPGGTDHSGSSNWLFGRQEHACEVRKMTLPLEGGQVRVQGENGGIEVIGEDRRDIYLEARVNTQGGTAEEAQQLLHQVDIVTHGTIEAKGPDTSGWHGRGWSVSFALRVPRQLQAASFETSNGGVAVTDLEGRVEVGSTNGALSLRSVAGEVRAHTTNGGISIGLSGNRLRGQGLDARTTNGGINVKASPNLSAHLVAETTNGGIHVGYPIAEGSSHTSVDTNIGGGGGTLHLETTNGGINVNPD